MINIRKYSCQNMDVNSYVLAKDNKALIIDPGFNGKKIIEHCQNHQLEIEKVILTHGHYDHIRDLKMLLNDEIIIYIHETEIDFLYNPSLNLSHLFKDDFILDKSVKVERIKDTDKIDFQKEQLKIIHIPGHTKGSVGIIYNQHFFSGDTLFYDSIGRTDLATGNQVQMHNSLKKIAQKLSKSTIVYPGHGKGGSLTEIFKDNPYLRLY